MLNIRFLTDSTLGSSEPLTNSQKITEVLMISIPPQFFYNEQVPQFNSGGYKFVFRPIPKPSRGECIRQSQNPEAAGCRLLCGLQHFQSLRHGLFCRERRIGSEKILQHLLRRGLRKSQHHQRGERIFISIIGQGGMSS